MDYVLVSIISVLMLGLTLTVFVLWMRTSEKQQTMMLELLSNREILIQGLLNQLRAQNPQTLQSLNAATLSPAFSGPDVYVPMTDSAEAARFEQLVIGDSLSDEDFYSPVEVPLEER